MSLNADTFLRGMKILKLTYKRFEFDLQDRDSLNIWYRKFKNFGDEEFLNLIDDFTDKSNYPPNSPKDILDIIPKVYSLDEAEEIIRDVYKRNTSIEFVRKELHKEYPLIYKFVSEFVNEVEKDTSNNECLGYFVIRPFKRKYKEYLDACVHYENDQLVTHQNLLLTQGETGIC